MTMPKLTQVSPGQKIPYGLSNGWRGLQLMLPLMIWRMTRYDPINDEDRRGWHVLLVFARRPAYSRWGLSIKINWVFLRAGWARQPARVAV